MADTFFGFGTSLNHDDHLLATEEVDCIETEEEEYDALNDETFGATDDVNNLDDWEEQHEHFAEIAESKKQSDKLENSLIQLVLDDTEERKYEVWPSFNASKQNGVNNNELWLKQIYNDINETAKDLLRTENQSRGPVPSSSSSPNIKQILKKICTVEELERGLLKSRQQNQVKPPQMPPNNASANLNQQPPYLFQMHPPPIRLPPGLHHPFGITPQHRPPVYPLPPMNCRIPPQFYPGHVGVNGPPHPPPGLMYPPQFPVNHPYNFPPPPRPPSIHNLQQTHQQHHQHHQQQQQHRNQQRRNDSNSRQQQKHEEAIIKDEYAGLMTNRDKQWLINIQLLQLNTGTPYFDDYYYTVFKERRAKTDRESDILLDKNQRHHNNRQQKDHHRNDRQDNANQLQPRVYIPQQFENSLGKLQCGSVTAPRKIIDMDVVTLDKDSENVNTPTRDTKKTKQLLLELEAFYSLMLKAEDLKNPIAIKNTENLRQLKQKQRLREIDAAFTPEQKQEILKLLQQESIPVLENQHDYFVKIINGLLQDDKFASFMNIRKGKMLLLRLLPYLTTEFHVQLQELWMKLFLSMAVIGRRDTSGDYLLPKFHPFYKRFIQSCKMSDILEIVTSLIEVVRPENNRSTPLSHAGRTPLHFVITNKFGVSALATTLVRTEYLISSGNTTEKQQADWTAFVTSWSETTAVVNAVAPPLELIPLQIFAKHCNRISGLTKERRATLQKYFVDTN